MLKTLLKLAVAAGLALAGTRAVAAEEACTASVCTDPTWPTMLTAAPPLVMEHHVAVVVVEESVAEHFARNEAPAGEPEATHAHVAALTFEEIMELHEEP